MPFDEIIDCRFKSVTKGELLELQRWGNEDKANAAADEWEILDEADEEEEDLRWAPKMGLRYQGWQEALSRLYTSCEFNWGKANDEFQIMGGFRFSIFAELVGEEQEADKMARSLVRELVSLPFIIKGDIIWFRG